MTIALYRPVGFINTQNNTPTGVPPVDDTWLSWVVDTSGTLTANVSDNNNSTRIKQPLNAFSTRTWTVGGWNFTPTAVPAGKYIDKIRYNITYDVHYISTGRGFFLNSHITRKNYDGQHNGLAQLNFACTSANVGTTTAIQTFTSGWIPKNLDTNTFWTVADFTTFFSAYGVFASTAFYGFGDLEMRIYEISLEISTNTIPTVTTSPTGTVSTTTQPAITVTYSDIDGDVPDREEVKIFDSAHYSAVGFDPATSTAVFSQIGPRNSTSASFSYLVTPPFNLNNGASYKAYARLRQAADGVWSDWGSSLFTISLDAPLAPILTGVVLDSQAGVQLSVASTDNILTANQASFELGTTAGWSAGSGSTIAVSTSQGVDGTDSMTVTRTSTTGIANAFISSSARATVAVGKQYTGLASFKAATTGRSCTVSLLWFDSTGTQIGSATGGSAITDTTGGWTQATVIGTAPTGATTVELDVSVGAVPQNEIHFVDRTGIMPGNTTIWGLGGFSQPAAINVEASTDGGITWNTVRNGLFSAWADITARTVSVVWYEAPPAHVVAYRCGVIGLLAGVPVQSPSSTIVSLTSNPTPTTGWWIVDPLDPTNNAMVDMSGEVKYDIKEEQGTYHPLGRKFPVVISDVMQAKTGSLPLYFEDRNKYNAFVDLRETLHTVLIKRVYTAASDQFYVKFGAGMSVTEGNYTPTVFDVSIDFTEVDAP